MKRALLLAILLGLSACDAGSTPAFGPAAPAAPAAAPAPAEAAPEGEITYYFGTSDARTTITFESRTEITNILGKTTKVDGSATIDFGKGTGRCHLRVPTLSLKTGMDDRDRAMYGKSWLDAKQFPWIEFKADKAQIVRPSVWRVDGKFTLHGVTRDLSVEVEVKPVPDLLGKHLGEGRWVRVRTPAPFKIRLEDFGIQIPDSAVATVEPVWNVALQLFGTTAKPAAPTAVADLPSSAEDEDMPVRVARVPKVSEEGISGTRYVFGLKPQLTTLKAESVTELENVTAVTTALSGIAGVDREKGAAVVRFRTLVASLKTGIDLRDEHLRGSDWLDAAKHPHIEFESTRATRKDDKTWTVEGKFTLHGQTRPLTLDVEVVEIPAELVKKAHWGDKAGLRCAGQFKVKLSDYGVKIPSAAVAKVSDVWTVSFSLVGLLSD
jgi:polyisoprenoid-binding protein YceI